MLAPNFGFSIKTHYCGGEAVKKKISLANEDLDCGMESLTEGECFHEINSEFSNISPKPCCEDQHESLRMDVDLNSSISSHTSTNLVYAVLLFVSKTNFSDRQDIDLKFLYTPPLPLPELTVLLQRFII